MLMILKNYKSNIEIEMYIIMKIKGKKGTEATKYQNIENIWK